MEERWQSLEYSYQKVQGEVLNFIDSYSKEHHLENTRQIPFRWTIYRRRPQVRYTLASIIIREILWGISRSALIFPRCRIWRSSTRFPESTVRRALDVLHAHGRDPARNGDWHPRLPGACGFRHIDKVGNPENLRLHGEALQILALTVRSVTRFTVESATIKAGGAVGRDKNWSEKPVAFSA